MAAFYAGQEGVWNEKDKAQDGNRLARQLGSEITRLKKRIAQRVVR